MPIPPTPIALLLLWLLAAAGVLRAMRIARRADDLAERSWEQLGRLHSRSGIAFFPTIDARRELELAISDAIDLERRAARWRRTRAASQRRVSRCGQGRDPALT